MTFSKNMSALSLPMMRCGTSFKISVVLNDSFLYMPRLTAMLPARITSTEDLLTYSFTDKFEHAYKKKEVFLLL